MRAAAVRIDHQIEVAVTIDIGQDGPSGIQIRTGDAGCFGNVLELPVAEIAEKLVRAVQSAKVKIAPTIAINIPAGHAGAVEQNLVGQVSLLAQRVSDKNSGHLRR